MAVVGKRKRPRPAVEATQTAAEEEPVAQDAQGDAADAAPQKVKRKGAAERRRQAEVASKAASGAQSSITASFKKKRAAAGDDADKAKTVDKASPSTNLFQTNSSFMKL